MMNQCGCVKSKLSPVALGLTLGVIKGIWMLVLAWLAWQWGYNVAMVDHIATFYHGYEATFVGGLLGGLWGLVCGFIFGIIFGYIYNFFLCFCLKCNCKVCPIDKK